MRKLFLVLSVAALLVACLVPSVAQASVKHHEGVNQKPCAGGWCHSWFQADATKYTANGMYHDSFSGRSSGRFGGSATPTSITLSQTWSWVTSSTSKTVTTGADISLTNISGHYDVAETTTPGIASVTWTGTSTGPTNIVVHNFDGICLNSLKSISSEEMSSTARFFFANGLWQDVNVTA